MTERQIKGFGRIRLGRTEIRADHLTLRWQNKYLGARQAGGGAHLCIIPHCTSSDSGYLMAPD